MKVIGGTILIIYVEDAHIMTPRIEFTISI